MTPMSELSREEIVELLDELAARLGAADVAARIYVVGGAAIALDWDTRRSTRDIDAVLRPALTVRDVAAQMGKERHLPADWLSDAVAHWVPAESRTAPARVHLRRGAVEIVTAPATHLLAMKMAAFRATDMSDLRLLVEHLGMTQAREIAVVCQEVYGPDSIALPSQDDLLWQAQVILDSLRT